jgi:hypothetical protein
MLEAVTKTMRGVGIPYFNIGHAKLVEGAIFLILTYVKSIPSRWKRALIWYGIVACFESGFFLFNLLYFQIYPRLGNFNPDSSSSLLDMVLLHVVLSPLPVTFRFAGDCTLIYSYFFNYENWAYGCLLICRWLAAAALFIHFIFCITVKSPRTYFYLMGGLIVLLAGSILAGYCLPYLFPLNMSGIE